MKYVLKGLPHAVIVMAGMMIVFFAIDRVNTPMGFMTNEFHKWLSFFLAVSCLIYSVSSIARQRRRERAQERAKAKSKARRQADQAAPKRKTAPGPKPVQQ